MQYNSTYIFSHAATALQQSLATASIGSLLISHSTLYFDEEVLELESSDSDILAVSVDEVDTSSDFSNFLLAVDEVDISSASNLAAYCACSSAHLEFNR